VLGSVSGLLTLCLKDSLLSRLESEEEGGDNKNRGAGRSAGKAKIGLVVVNSGEGEAEEEEEREYGFANFYGNDDHDGDAAEMANVINPMMAAAAAAAAGSSTLRVVHYDDRTQALKLSEESTALELKLHEVLTENSQLEMKKLKLKEDNARLENEQMTTTTMMMEL
jgi:hypothetical protein